MQNRKRNGERDEMSDIARERGSMFGPKMNFAATEAYKLLRTNILFSFPDEANCHIIGMTSSLRGEGKSLTAMNLTYSLAEYGKRVLLIEGDMRLPTMDKRLRLRSSLGLSNLLVGLSDVREAIQILAPQGSMGADVVMHVITAGDMPPNPSELLGSNRMHTLLQTLSCSYDYILIDLPPITAVSDALVVSKLVNGIVMVVRYDYAERGSLDDAIRQLQFVNARILGFVFNGASEGGSGYGKHYSRYYQKDGGYYKADSGSSPRKASDARD